MKAKYAGETIGTYNINTNNFNPKDLEEASLLADEACESAGVLLLHVWVNKLSNFQRYGAINVSLDDYSYHDESSSADAAITHQPVSSVASSSAAAAASAVAAAAVASRQPSSAPFQVRSTRHAIDESGTLMVECAFRTCNVGVKCLEVSMKRDMFRCSSECGNFICNNCIRCGQKCPYNSHICPSCKEVKHKKVASNKEKSNSKKKSKYDELKDKFSSSIS